MQTALNTTTEDAFAPPIDTNLRWSGANNTNHFFTLGDFFDTSKASPGFTNRLQNAGTTVDTYDRYTFYRMLDELGTDSSPDEGKLNLNYANAVVQYNFSGMVTNIKIIHRSRDESGAVAAAEFFTPPPTSCCALIPPTGMMPTRRQTTPSSPTPMV